MDRRSFLKNAGLVSGGLVSLSLTSADSNTKRITKLTQAEREAMKRGSKLSNLRRRAFLLSRNFHFRCFWDLSRWFMRSTASKIWVSVELR